MSVAIITGASKGLGKALAASLAANGWSLVLDARTPDALAGSCDEIRSLQAGGETVGVPGDVRDPAHRRELVEAARRLGGLDLLVNNASTLGVSPLPALRVLDPATALSIYETNVVAPLALIQEALPLLDGSERPRIVNVTSDASVEPYTGWGGYGASKAALDHLSAILAAEEVGIVVYAVDPGDMRTDMHQDAFPGEDISDRPLPEDVVPHLVALIDSGLPSGRYKAAEVVLAPGSGADALGAAS
ncbi:MAG TPA: SDR family NAD(P)-dependent oxidoreductase [Acidimicrobiales bacterium]|nr:SDR family NAD(P)-dependent oxidoreductase [Acidimicrobiales bacterium]